MERGFDVDRDYELVVLESYNRDSNEGTTGRSDFQPDTQTGNYRSDETGKQMGSTGTAGSMNDQSDRDRSGMTDSLGTDNLSSRDRDLTDRDRTGTTGTTDPMKDRNMRENDDTFYNRGEFDSDKYRSNR
jgi:hypothetical protein